MWDADKSGLRVSFHVQIALASNLRKPRYELLFYNEIREISSHFQKGGQFKKQHIMNA